MLVRDGRKLGTRKGGREGGCKWREIHDVRGSVPSSVGTLSLGRIGGQNSNQTEGAKTGTMIHWCYPTPSPHDIHGPHTLRLRQRPPTHGLLGRNILCASLSSISH